MAVHDSVYHETMTMNDFTRRFGFPTGALKNTSAADALRFFQSAGFPSPEIHPRGPADPLFRIGKELFPDASIHLPSSPRTPENEALEVANAAVAHGYERLIVHPYVIRNAESWQQLGSRLVIENMDFRSPGFMTADDMAAIFSIVPEARFCLDLAHTYGWCADEAGRLIDRLSDRLVAVHYSEIDRITGDHFSAVSNDAIKSHATHLKRISPDVPIVFETGPSDPPAILSLRQRVMNSLHNPTDTFLAN